MQDINLSLDRTPIPPDDQAGVFVVVYWQAIKI